MAVLELAALYLDSVSDESGADRPSHVNRDPCPDETGVPSAWHIAFDVVDSGGDGIALATVAVRVNDVLAFDGTSGTPIQSGFDGAGSGYSAITDGWRIRLQPTTPYDSEELVEVEVDSQVTGFPEADQTSWEFTAEDSVAPSLVSVTAIGQKLVRLEFDEPVAVVDAGGFTFAATTRPAVPLSPVGAVADGVFVDVTTDIEQTPGAGYTVTVDGVEDLSGNGETVEGSFTGFVPAKPEGRSFEVRELFPDSEVEDDQSGDLALWLACLQDVVDLILAELDRFPDLFSIDRIPSDFLEVLLADLGNPFGFALDESRKRKLASVLVEMYQQSGTAVGIENAIRFLVGVNATVEAYTDGTLVLGESELGVDWILGPGGQRELYSFLVVVDEALTSAQRQQVYEIAMFMKPAHTHLEYTGEGVVEPSRYPGIVEPVETELWILDVSQLDLDTTLGD